MTKVEVCTHLLRKTSPIINLSLVQPDLSLFSPKLQSQLQPQSTCNPILWDPPILDLFLSSTLLTSLSSSNPNTTSNPTLILEFLVLRYRTAFYPGTSHHRLPSHPPLGRADSLAHYQGKEKDRLPIRPITLRIAPYTAESIKQIILDLELWSASPIPHSEMHFRSSLLRSRSDDHFLTLPRRRLS